MWEHFPSISLNSQMKSFIGTANMMPARPPGGKGGAEQHRPHLRKRAGLMGRNLSCAKWLDNALATGHDWPSFPGSLRLLVSLLRTVLCCHEHPQQRLRLSFPAACVSPLLCKLNRKSFNPEKVGLLSFLFRALTVSLDACIMYESLT